MKYFLIIYSFTISMLFHSQTNAQGGNWKHFTLKEGLPATTIYSITQDKKGFIWIGTEAGLVRYDGTEFKTYTINDGLPDNEIIGVTTDSLDRIWITPYKKSICYYKEGKIYTEKTDTLLSRIAKQTPTTCTYFVGKNNRMWIYAQSIFCLSKNEIRKIELPSNDLKVRWIEDVNDHEFFVYTTTYFLKYKNNLLVDSFKVRDKNNNHKTNINVHKDSVYFSTNDSVLVFLKNNDFHFQLINTLLVKGNAFSHCINVGNKLYIPSIGFGTYVIDCTKKTTTNFEFIPNNSNSVFKDKDNNLWVATANNGIMFQPYNTSIFTINCKIGLQYDNAGCVYADSDGNIYIGDGVGALRCFSNGKLKTIIPPKYSLSQYFKSKKIVESNGLIAFSSDGYALMIYNKSNKKTILSSQLSTKTFIYSDNKKQFIAGLSSGISFTSIHPPYNTSFIEDVKRVTTICENKEGNLYCGTPEGLYLWKKSFIPLFKNDDILSNRIIAIVSDKYNITWVNVSSNYLVALLNNKIIYTFKPTDNSVFTGAICHSMFADRNDNIWVATNNGLNKLNYSFNALTQKVDLKSITPYSTSDGLADNNINDVFVRDSIVYVATAKGVSVFNFLNRTASIGPPIFITNIAINQKDTTIQTRYDLSFQENNISIKYAGISFISDGKISYRYKLIGSDDKWNYTNLNQIEIKSLHDGAYTFIVEALDKFGTPSKKAAQISFTIQPAFYNTWVFKALFIVITIFLIYLSFRFSYEKRRKKELEKMKLKETINQLEQKALRAQMNPHFIFNSLSAIQHYINNEEATNADKYLIMFSRLIRKTLNNSTEATISIEKEISYLENYILLEQMRFKNKFSYAIRCDTSIDKANTYLPTMLLQPFVENAIRHGLMHQTNNYGKLIIQFFMKENKLFCTIDDNGIGINATQQMKTNAHIAYQSKGITISSDRIEAINAINEQKIVLKIEDKQTLQPASTGTLITLTIS